MTMEGGKPLKESKGEFASGYVHSYIASTRVTDGTPVAKSGPLEGARSGLCGRVHQERHRVNE